MTRPCLQHPALLACVAIVGFALSSFGRVSAGECDRKTRSVAAGQPLVVRQLDSVGMRDLLGRRPGRRRPLVLYLFYTACRPCTDRLGDIERLFDEYQPRGLDVVLVSIAPMDDPSKLTDVLGRMNAQIPTFLLDKLDDDFAEEFFLRDWEPVVPSVFLYNPRGKLQYSRTNAESISFRSLQRLAEDLLRLHKN